jgi:hypothetical protein
MILVRTSGLVGLLGALGLLVLPGCGSGNPSYSDAVMDRLRTEGVAPGLVYTVEVPGHDLAEQSVGVHGDDGFGAVHVSPEGEAVALTVERGTFDDEECRTTAVPNAEPPGTTVSCERDDAGWYRTAGDQHQYIAVRDDHVVRLGSATDDLDRDTLRTALVNAHQVTPDESDSPPTTTGSSTPTSVERGDLPATGDGAPDNHVGPGG